MHLKSVVGKLVAGVTARRERPSESIANASTAHGEALDIRPLSKATRRDEFSGNPPIDRDWVRSLLASAPFAAICREYGNYPRLSFVSDVERAFLFCLVRAMKPQAVAEIGTGFCGTSEVIARALWENGSGLLHTTDPFGAERCPAILRQWPQPLQDTTRFHVKSSMDFFATLLDEKIMLDIAFIDGNHDFEYASFDIMMAARLLRPRGVLIIDNAEQSGPFYAAARFLRDNPDWTELGEAIAGFAPAAPFRAERSSVADGSFLLLQAPGYYPVGETPRSTGQLPVATARVDGMTVTLDAAATPGTVHFQTILRAFRNGNREVEEYKKVGTFGIDDAAPGHVIEYRFDEPLVSRLNERYGDCVHTVEIELVWQGAAQRTLRLAVAPQPWRSPSPA